MQVRYQVPIASLTTFQNEGSVDEVISVDTLDELRAFLAEKRPFHVLGKGSNTLINPEAQVSTFLQISPQWKRPTLFGTHQLAVGAGVTVSALMKACVEYELTGLEFAAGVPASVGGMVAMNFGCYGHEISDFITRVGVVTFSGELRWLSREEMQFSYRHSRVQVEPWIVVEVELQLQGATREVVKATQARFIADRLAKQPLRDRTFGSTFINPPGQFAGALIESMGFKGNPQGHVSFSAQHANFLVNLGGATYAEAVSLIEIVQAQVHRQHHISLKTEVKFIS